MTNTVRPYLLDTSIALICIRGGPTAEILEKRYSIRESTLRPLISIVSLGELYALALKKNWSSTKIDAIRKIADQLIVVNIEGPELLYAYAEVDNATEPHGKTLSKNDLWIAATAKITRATLLTTDKDFDALFPAQIDRICLDPKTGEVRPNAPRTPDTAR